MRCLLSISRMMMTRQRYGLTLSRGYPAVEVRYLKCLYEIEKSDHVREFRYLSKFINLSTAC